MGCNCGKKQRPRPAPAPQQEQGSGVQQTYALEMPDGSVSSYGSRLEAEAARVRAGGRGSVRPG